MLEPGHEIDRYVVENVLGQGGMATVYKVQHSRLKSKHAMKVLAVAGTAMADRLLQEGQLQATLSHQNVVRVTDVLELNGAPALVMEYIDGPTLDSWLKVNDPGVELATEIFKGIVQGVGYAHILG